MSLFKIAIRRQDDGFVRAFLEFVDGDRKGERIELSIISARLAEDPVTFAGWQRLLEAHLVRMMKEFGVDLGKWETFGLERKN